MPRPIRPWGVIGSHQHPKGAARSIKPEVFIVEGVCTHLGCSPTLKKEVGAASDMGADWPGGYYCPCHNSRFDLAARVSQGVAGAHQPDRPPAPLRERYRVVIVKTREPEMAGRAKAPVTSAGPFNGLLTWVDQRFPLVHLYKDQLTDYYAPKNSTSGTDFGDCGDGLAAESVAGLRV